MKTLHFTAGIIAAVIVLILVAGCSQRKTAAPSEEESSPENYLGAINRFFTEDIAGYYPKGEACIPFHSYIAVDESDADDIQVLGDFWALIYNQAGDTLKCIAGGNHPGKLHIGKDEEGNYTVISFDAVADGASYEPSAKLIFGERFPEFQAANSNDVEREKARAASVAEYVKEHGLSVKMYQDYGWPVVMLP